jgi:hypothetical protein
VLDVLLTVPHGAPGNDVAAPLVGRGLHRRLRDAGFASLLLLNSVDRLDDVDGNRPEARDLPFRRSILGHVPARLLIDVHSFPDHADRYTGKDIVLLHTEGVQTMSFLERYADFLRAAALVLGIGDHAVVEIMEHQHTDDVVEEAVRHGQKTDANMLAEHNEQGDCALYATMHELAVTSLWKERGW